MVITNFVGNLIVYNFACYHFLSRIDIFQPAAMYNIVFGLLDLSQFSFSPPLCAAQRITLHTSFISRSLNEVDVLQENDELFCVRRIYS